MRGSVLSLGTPTVATGRACLVELLSNSLYSVCIDGVKEHCSFIFTFNSVMDQPFAISLDILMCHFYLKIRQTLSQNLNSGTQNI